MVLVRVRVLHKLVDWHVAVTELFSSTGDLARLMYHSLFVCER
jgi:hypothetical protein